MKLIFLITILLCSNLFSQNIIQIIGTDESVNEYSIDEIENLTFDLENTATAKFNLKDGNSNNLNIDNASSLRFANDMLIFENNASMVQVALADLESIEFEAPEQESRYPFGELDVDEVVVNNLTNPWSIDFIDNENLIFTELDGRLYTYNIPNADLQQINGLPNITAIGQGGLIDVTLHPDFENNRRVYLVYSIGADWQFTTAVGYGILNGNSLENFVEIFQGFPLTGDGVHFGSRIIFDNDGKLYFAIGDRGEQDRAQDKSNHYGSVLRINDDGTVPSDNPFLNDNQAQPQLYTIGNRNIQGMFYIPENDQIWAVEHGPQGGDELNLIESGQNYSWPLATYGINYDGTPITETKSIPGNPDPITYWVPSIAPCGMGLIDYDSESGEIDLVIATLRGQHLHRLKVKDKQVVDVVESLNGYARFRDVQLSPDGYLYATTQSPGRIIKLKMK